MTKTIKLFTTFSLLMLITTLLFGLLSSWAFLYPETYNNVLPFQQLRPMHVSAALFWIISGAVCCALYYSRQIFGSTELNSNPIRIFVIVWVASIITVFVYYSLKRFGGREYWEFPSWISIPIFISWGLLMFGYYKPWMKVSDKKPLYLIMWATGILFFSITFLEQNLWHIDWFRQSYLREVTVQWKANGSMVGAWNQMIYGTSLFLMVKISGEETIARNNKVYAFYFLSLSNLMFNWGHHIYNVPTANWIRHVSYFISMTEWLFFISMIQSFRTKLSEHRKLKHLITYKFLITSEIWLFLNLLLAIMMSIPAINRYTHGTHITVAHAMGTTIGINTMILLGGIGYMIGIDNANRISKKLVTTSLQWTNIFFFVFWISLIVAGILKGYRSVALQMTDFREMMQPVLDTLKVFSISGVGVVIGLGTIAVIYLLLLKKNIYAHTDQKE